MRQLPTLSCIYLQGKGFIIQWSKTYFLKMEQNTFSGILHFKAHLVLWWYAFNNVFYALKDKCQRKGLFQALLLLLIVLLLRFSSHTREIFEREKEISQQMQESHNMHSSKASKRNAIETDRSFHEPPTYPIYTDNKFWPDLKGLLKVILGNKGIHFLKYPSLQGCKIRPFQSLYR